MQGRPSVALNVPGHLLPKPDRKAREKLSAGLVVELHVGQDDLSQRALGRLEHRAKQNVAALALKPDGDPHARVRQVEGLERRVGRDHTEALGARRDEAVAETHIILLAGAGGSDYGSAPSQIETETASLPQWLCALSARAHSRRRPCAEIDVRV